MLVLLRNRKIPFCNNRLVLEYCDQKESSRRHSRKSTWMRPWDFALQPGPPETAIYWKTELKTTHPWGLGWGDGLLGWSDGGAWAWETETWVKMSAPLSTDCGILNKPGPGRGWIWRCLGLFSPSETIHRLANTFSHHLRKCLQDHYDGRSSYKSVD